MTYVLAEMSMMAARDHDRRTEATVRRLLERWVSEFEPSIATRHGMVIGLCVAGDPSGSIPIRVPGLDLDR